MKSISKYSIIALKGFGMGAANVVPGVSGGTIALLTGIYSRIVDSLNSLTQRKTWKALFRGEMKEFWKCIDGNFLAALLIGVLVSVFSLAKLMTYVLAYYPISTWAFFFGLIVASALIMFKDVKDWKPVDVVFAVAGAALGVIVCTLTPTRTPDGLWFIFICGVVAICTMILPGISGSFILLVMGKYDYIMQAIADLDMPVIIVMAAGCVVGILAFAKLLHWLLARWEKRTMIVLLGFVVGSLVKVWPWSDKEAIAAAQVLRSGNASPIDLQIPGAVIWCIAGIALVLVLEFAGKGKKR